MGVSCFNYKSDLFLPISIKVWFVVLLPEKSYSYLEHLKGQELFHHQYCIPCAAWGKLCLASLHPSDSDHQEPETEVHIYVY